MTYRLCEQLDDYLAGELEKEHKISFEQHLLECESCNNEVAEWSRLRGLLQEASRQRESPPEELVQWIADASTLEHRDPIVTAKSPTRNRSKDIAAVAAACLVAAAFFVAMERPEPERIEKKELPWVTTLEPPKNVQLSENAIGVPIDIDDPNVTVVWVYETRQADQSTNSITN